MAQQGYSHGNNFGNQAGASAERQLPGLLEFSQRAEQQLAFAGHYIQLRASTMSAQARGQEFEKLTLRCYHEGYELWTVPLRVEVERPEM
jgi:hypothetical protein